MSFSAWRPVPLSHQQTWRAEGRSALWQALVHRVHGADAADSYRLSVPDAERIVDAVLDEIRGHGGSPYPCEYGEELPRLCDD